jgi:hypothetical protein
MFMKNISTIFHGALPDYLVLDHRRFQELHQNALLWIEMLMQLMMTVVVYLAEFRKTPVPVHYLHNQQARLISLMLLKKERNLVGAAFLAALDHCRYRGREQTRNGQLLFLVFRLWK